VSSVDRLQGRTLGDFVLREKVGEGQFGSVHRAEQPLLEREAVVKILRENHRADQRTIQRFMREARLAARLDHPYAAHIYAFGAEPDGVLWIAMELVRGTPLEQLLGLQGPLPLPRFVPFVEKLCEVIATAHEQGIVHRDLKPANVMVVSRGGKLWPKLLDFGVAKLVEAEPPADEKGVRMGSPAYLAPELWRDAGAADARSDLYALGVMSYQTLTGKLPFAAASLAALARAHVERPLPALGDKLPAAVHAVLARATAKKPDERYATVTEFAAALRGAAGLDEARAHVPMLDEAVRRGWMHDAPQPLAEAVAALEAASALPQAADAVVRLVRVLAHWLGIVSLASRADRRTGMGAVDDDEKLTATLHTMRRRALGDEEWLELARDACRPFAARADAFAMPELVAQLCPDDGAKPLGDELIALKAQTLEAAAMAPDQARARLTACMTTLASLLGRLAFVGDYALVVPRAGRDPSANVERWMGVRRTPRPLSRVDGEVKDAEPLLLARDGTVVAELFPLVQVAPPAPGAADEMFFLEGSGRHGAKLVAIPFGFERHDERPWDWMRQTFVSSDPGADAFGDERAPYRGLSAFTPADADVFFGREREAVAFVNRLRAHPLVAVVGASGAGKSSFVQAGVIPTLPPAFRAVTARPGARPTAALRARLRAEGWLGDEELDDAQLPGELRARAQTRGQLLLVVIDQFEETFTLGADADERLRYAKLLAALARHADDPIRVVLTMRDDFLMRAQTLPPLRAHLMSGLELLATPSPADLLRIVVEPARRAGYAFDPADLPLEIVQAVAHEPGALALVSFTASKMWELRDANHHVLGRAAYDKLGGVGGALAQHAEATLAAMPPEQLGLVREAFRHLVTADGTRAVITRRDLAQLTGGGGEREPGERPSASANADAAIEQLVATRLLVTTEGVDGVENVEVVHEALLSAWPRLVQWRREDAEGARLRDQLRTAARQWAERARDRGLLWRGEALVELKLWRARHKLPLTDTEEAFVAASLREAARARLMRYAAVAFAFVALAGGLGVVRRQRIRAEADAQRARLRLGEQYEEEARQALLAGAATRALVYLQEAQQLGVDDNARRFLFAAAADATAAQRQVLAGHTGGVRAAVFSHDGSRVATGSDDGTARVWDAATGAQLRLLIGHASTVMDLDFAPDDARIATASFDGTARIWDGATGALRATLAHPPSVTTARFSADGTRVITAGKDGTARIFDAASGQLVRTLAGHEDRLRFALFSPDGTRVFTGGDDDRARLWDVATGRVLAAIKHKRLVSAGAWSPDGTLVAAASDDGTAELRKADGAPLFTLEGHSDFVRSVAFSPDGKRVATGSWDNTARIWDVATGKLVAVLDHRSGMVGTVAWSPDGKRVITAGGDGTAKIWEATGGNLVAVLEAHQSGVIAATFSPDGASVVTASADKTARLWDGNAGAPLLTVAATDPNSARFSPDGKRFVVASTAGHAKIFDTATGTMVRDIVEGGDTLTLAVWSPDGRTIATASPDKTAVLFDAETGARVRTFAGHARAVMYVAFSPDGTRLATTSEDDTARIWDVASGAVVHTLVGHADNVSGVAWSPDGTLLATTSWDKSVRLWNAATGALVRAIGGHPSSLQNVSFAPDGKRFLVAQDSGTGNVYDVATGALVGTLVGHVGMMEVGAFSPDGTLILSAGNDRTARIWDAQTFRLLQVHGAGAQFYDDVMIDPSGSRLLTANGDGAVRIFSMPRFGGSPADAAALVRTRAPFRLDGGKLVATNGR
jgi:WD40 repeat protein/tRNA A-37 threonylcarbamoyl transferase component Bud32